MIWWDSCQTISASLFFLVLPLPSSLYLTLQAPLSKRTQVRFLLVKFETKIIQDFRLPRYSWMNWSLLSNQVLLQTILISTQSYLILSYLELQGLKYPYLNLTCLLSWTSCVGSSVRDLRDEPSYHGTKQTMWGLGKYSQILFNFTDTNVAFSIGKC